MREGQQDTGEEKRKRTRRVGLKQDETRNNRKPQNLSELTPNSEV